MPAIDVSCHRSHPLLGHRRSCTSSVWQGAATDGISRASTYLSWQHEGSPCIPVRLPRALPSTSSHPHHAASQRRPPRVETGKTGAAQSMSKAVRGLPIVERRGSIAPGLHPLAVGRLWGHLDRFPLRRLVGCGEYRRKILNPIIQSVTSITDRGRSQSSDCIEARPESSQQ